MIFSIKLGLLAAFLVSSCSTTYDLKHSKPQFTYTTKKSADEVMKCIRDKWREHINPVQEEKTSHGWLVRHFDSFPNDTTLLVTIEEIEAKVEVKYFHRLKSLKIARIENDVMNCK